MVAKERHTLVRQGHFHFHAGSVSRAKGYSSVKVAAYQSGQQLNHEYQLVSHLALRIEGEDVSFDAPYATRHDLRQGIISEDLKNSFSAHGIELSDVATGKTKKGGGFEIINGDTTYSAKRHNVVDTLSLDHRKRLNKGVITDEFCQELAELNVHLSDAASAVKDNRRQWTITDGEQSYRVKEHEKKTKDSDTGKWFTKARVLHVYADNLHNFKNREDVRETALLVPTHAPIWLREIEAKGKDIALDDRQAVWNTVESQDADVDSKTAHRMNFALSRELSYVDNKAVLHAFVQEQFTDKGLIADVAIHEKTASDDKPNLHAHVLVNTREIKKDGQFATRKSGYWDRKERIEEWRQGWADKLNTALQDSGSDVRVDPRSYERQGLDIVAGQHMGADWYAAERAKTDVAQENERIEAENKKRDRRLEEISKRLYTGADQREYEAQQTMQYSQIYEPDTISRNAQVEKIKEAETHDLRSKKRIERLLHQQRRALQDAEDATSVKTTWYGSQTSHLDLTKVRPIWLNNRPPTPSPVTLTRLSYAHMETRTQFFGLGSKITTIQRPGDANLSRKERGALEQKFKVQDASDAEAQTRLEHMREYHLRSLAGFLGDNSSGSSTHEIKERLHRLKDVSQEKFQEIRERLQTKERGSENEPER